MQAKTNLTPRAEWVTASLGEIFETVTGRTPPKKEKINYGRHTLFVKPPDLYDNLVISSIDMISQIGRDSSCIAPVGSVLVTCIGNLGRTGILKEEAAFNQQINAIYPCDKVLPKFVFYYAQSPGFKNQLEGLSSATTVAIVNKGKFNTISFSYPPLPEQRAIVAKLERLFAELDRSVAELETARERLGVYRQSVLDSLMMDYPPTQVSKVVVELSQGWSPKCERTSRNNSDQWAVIKTSAIQPMAFVENENKALPETLDPREQHEIHSGDILITRAGPRNRVGVCCRIKTALPRLINCDKVYKIILDNAQVSDAYFEYALNTPKLVNAIDRIKTGGSDSGLNLTQPRFLKLEFPLPSIELQKEIVDEVESRFSVADRLEQDIAESLERAKGLRQGVLKRAFAGELV